MSDCHDLLLYRGYRDMYSVDMYSVYVYVYVKLCAHFYRRGWRGMKQAGKQAGKKARYFHLIRPLTSTTTWIMTTSQSHTFQK